MGVIKGETRSLDNGTNPKPLKPRWAMLTLKTAKL